MGQIKEPIPVVVLLAVTSRHPTAFQWARQQSEAHWGAVELESCVFSFDQTQYYASTMGVGLKKQFFAFRDLMDPAGLSRLKIQTNDWESAYQTEASCRKRDRSISIPATSVKESSCWRRPRITLTESTCRRGSTPR